jgi:diguanylate cyclase (GGDEF)-like protein
MDASSWSVEHFVSAESEMDVRTQRTPTIIQVYVFVAVAVIFVDIFLQHLVLRQHPEWAILVSSIAAIALVGFGIHIANRATRQSQYLKEMLNIDRTTGLYSSVFLMEELERIVNGEAKNMVLLFLDVDDLKAFNDTYGHRAGDKLIHDAAEALAEGIVGQGVGFRYGGDEFVAILEDVTTDGAIRAAKRVQLLLKGRRISASIGLYPWHHGMKVDELLSAADKAMYSAKKSGKGRIYLGDIDTSYIADAAQDEMI